MINLKTVTIFSFFSVILKRIKSKSQKAKNKLRLLPFAFCFLLSAFCSPLIAKGSSPLLGDSLLIQGSSVSGNVGDVVTINFTVNNFVDVSALGFSINWNPNLVQFTSVSNIGIGSTTTANVDTSSAPIGAVSFSWVGANQTLPNQSNLISISFKILKGGKLPILVNITDFPTSVTCARFGSVMYPVRATAGTISVLNGCNSRPPALKCSDAPLLCPADFPYCAALPDSNTATNPGNLCGQVDNNVWIAFKPSTTSVSFTVNVTNCIGTTSGADGLQVSVYSTSDYVHFNKIFCNAAINRNFSSATISLNTLTIDSVYYMMFDGNNADICDFTVDIIKGNLHGNGATAPTFTSPDSVCNYQTAFFSIINPDPANQYQWRLGAGSTALLPKPTIANAVKVFWDTNPDSVCARTITRCDTSAWTCKRIAIRNGYNITVNAMKCVGSAYVWNGKSYGIAGDYPITYKSSAGCDSLVTLHLLDFMPTPKIIDTVVCGSSFVFLGQTYNATGTYNTVAAQKNFLGCDSLITLRLTFLTTSLNVSKSNDLTCTLKSAQLSVTVNNVTPSSAVSTYEWKGTNNVVVGSTNSVTVNAADIYTVTIKTSYQNTSCIDTKTITVKNLGASVPKAIIVSPSTICKDQAQIFSLSNTDADTKSVNWTTIGGSVVVNGFNASFTPSSNNSKLCAGITNSCGVGDTACVNLISKDALINPDFVGVFSTCPSSIQNYIISQSQAGVNYVWSVTNGTITGTNNGVIVSVQWKNTDGKICVTASNGCGNPLQVCKNVSVSSASANKNAITGRTSFCAGESVTYSITTSPSDKVQWSVPAGFIAQSKIDSTVLVGVATNVFTTGKLCVSIINSCNVKSDTCITLSIASTTPDSVPIAFNNCPLPNNNCPTNSICSDDTSTFQINTPTTYISVQWNVPSGAKIVSGANTKTIRVVWQNALVNAPLSATYFNNCNISRTTTIFVSVKDAVINAPNMDGPKLTCPKTRSTYSIPQQSSGISYTWHIPSGGTIEGRTDSNVLKVFWDSATTGDVCVDLQNTCKVKKSVCLSVDVRATIDSLPINGSTVVCADSTGTFSVSFDENADSYFWRPPSGATIMSGAGTNQVKIKFPPNTSGNVCCYPNGGCADGTSSCFFVSVIDPPALPSQISGNASVCVGDTVQFSITPTIGTLGINWSVPQNLEVIAGLFSKTITVVVRDTFSGNVCMSPQGNCKNNAAVCLRVLASQLPKPIIVTDTSVCSTTFSLKVNATGKIAWRLIQAPNGGTATFSQPTSNATQITTNTSGIFIFGVTESNGSCKKEVTTKVRMRTSPIISNVSTRCTRESDYYAVSFTMSSSTAQQFVVNGSTSGSSQGNSFSSFFIKQNTPYWFVVTDESGCTSDTIRGQVYCPCFSQAGNITSNSTTACFGDSIKIQKVTSSALDRNDAEEFILYSASANGSKQFLQRNKTGVFVFDSSKMSRDVAYTVQLLVGDSLKSGIVDTNARCISYSSNSLKVNFRNQYNASISFDTIVCPLSLATAQFSTNAPRNVSFTLMEGSNSLGFFNATNNTKLTVRPSKSGYIKLLNPKDDAGCSVRSIDSTFVNVRNLPIANAGDDQAICARTTLLNAVLDSTTTTGHWENSNSAVIVSAKSASTKVSNLENGKNVFVWVVSDKVCPAFEVRDSVNIFLPFIPKTNSLSLITKVGVAISANLVEAAPNGAYTITRLTDPNTGRFDFFSDGKFNYIPDNKYVGIVKFKFVICSALCNAVCDTSEVRILINADSTNIISVNDTVEVPNAITPNGDGKNDYLQIDHLSNYPNNELLIFNRWGETVFQAKPYNNDWSGNNQTNSPLPIGTYYYLLRLDVNNGKILKGDITILRN